MAVIIPKLALNDFRDAALPEYAQDKVDKITASGAFAAVVPSPAQLLAKKNQFEAALVAADDGNRAQTVAKDNKRKELEAMLTQQAQNCAEIANGNLEVYLESGYKAKDTAGSPVGPLEVVTGFLLDYGDNAGELKANWDVLAHADNYTLQFYSDPVDPDGSIIKQDIAKKSRAITDGLPGGQIVWARVRGNGGSTGHGPWSDPAEKRVP